MQAKKHESLTVPARASVGFTLVGAVAKLLSVMTTPLFTRLLTAEEYGLYSLYTTWLGIFSVIFTLGIGSAVLYRGMQKFPAERDGILTSALLISHLSLLLFLLVYLFLRKSIEPFLGLSFELTLFLFMQAAQDLSLSLHMARCRFLYRPLSYAVPRLARDLIVIAISLFLLTYTRHPETARIRALLFGTLALSLPLTLRLLLRGQRQCKKTHFCFLFSLALPLFPHAAAEVLLAEGGRAVIGRTLGKTALAHYGIAASLGGALSLLTVGINSALHPWIMRKAASGEKEKLLSLAELIALLLTVMTAALLLLAPELLGILAPASYRGAIAAVLPIAVSVLPHFLSGMLTSTLVALDKARVITRTTLAAAVLSLTLDALLVPAFGIVASAYITLGTSLFLLLLRFLSVRRLLGALPHARRIFFLLASDLLLLPLLSALLPHLSLRLALLLPLLLLLLPIGKRALPLLSESVPAPTKKEAPTERKIK